MNRHNEAEMREHYEAWQASGLGKKVYAKREGLSPSTFYYWIKKFDEAVLAEPAKGFQSIQIDKPMTSAIAIVRYPSGVSIEWHGHPEMIHHLKSLL